MAHPTHQTSDRSVTPAAVRPARGRWTHLSADPTTTVCGRAFDPGRWTVVAHGRVHDVDWCEKCWNRHWNRSAE